MGTASTRTRSPTRWIRAALIVPSTAFLLSAPLAASLAPRLQRDARAQLVGNPVGQLHRCQHVGRDPEAGGEVRIPHGLRAVEAHLAATRIRPARIERRAVDARD